MATQHDNKPVKVIQIDPALDPPTAQHMARLAAAEAERAGFTPVIDQPYDTVPGITGDEPMSWSVPPPGDSLRWDASRPGAAPIGRRGEKTSRAVEQGTGPAGDGRKPISKPYNG
jgi:hypothetical protein